MRLELSGAQDVPTTTINTDIQFLTKRIFLERSALSIDQGMHAQSGWHGHSNVIQVAYLGDEQWGHGHRLFMPGVIDLVGASLVENIRRG